jgi:hypothetical protein
MRGTRGGLRRRYWSRTVPAASVRQDQGDPAFALVDLQPAAAPIDRVQREGDDLARAQAVGGDEEEHRVVAEAVRGATIHRA